MNKGKEAGFSSEIELQYLWSSVKSGTFFSLDDGRQIEIVYPGQWNVERGPDFLAAKIKLDDSIITGDVEIHTSAVNWFYHGHQNNSSYDNVILHVALFPSSLSRLTAPAPLLILKNEDIKRISKNALTGGQKYFPGLCSDRINKSSPEKLMIYFSETGKKRLSIKALKFLSEIISIGSSEAFLKRLFEACGYKNNRNEFLELYRRFSLHPDASSEIEKEAVIWGESGFLDAPDISEYDEAIHSYFRSMWEYWWKLRKEHRSQTISWTRANVRYFNSPWRRVAGLSLLLKNSDFDPSSQVLNLISLHSSDVKLIEAMISFFTISHPLLNSYLSFSSKLKKPALLIGKSRALDIIGNIVIPWLLAYARNENKPELAARVLSLWEILPHSGVDRTLNISLQRWLIPPENAGKIFKTFSAAQGALYLYKNFCFYLGMQCGSCPKRKPLSEMT